MDAVSKNKNQLNTFVRRLRRFGKPLIADTEYCHACNNTGWDGETYLMVCLTCGRERLTAYPNKIEGSQ